MTDIDRKKAAKAFSEYWKDRGDEKSDSQSFWLALVRDVLGVREPEKFILFEERVKLDHTSFIDGHIPSTHVLIEQGTIRLTNGAAKVQPLLFLLNKHVR